MKRHAIDQLIEWKHKHNRKPLIIRGARQVGKTWIMKEFGRQHYEKHVYINFEDNPKMERLFSLGLDTERLLEGLSAYSGTLIDEHTLLIFDEVQAVPKALTSLKYFNENAPQYQIVAAGSLLGIALHQGTSFPVGKVEFMDLYPLSFSEFLCAVNHENYAELLESDDIDLIGALKHEFVDLLKKYMFVGGMPEAVAQYAQSKDYITVREIQRSILMAYENDFSKHAPNNIVPRIRMLWHSVPRQLAKKNRKFIYGLIKEGARAREYELALLWLVDCGLVHKVNRVSSGNLPLKAYEDMGAFKLYMVDTGLLCALSGIEASAIIDGESLFTDYKGAVTEQFALQQLICNGITPFYWSSERSIGEVDFVFQANSKVVPLEVKAGENLQAKSLRVFTEKHKIEKAMRTSLSDFRRESWLVNLPLYMIEGIMRYL
ncbi:MAG: ATP-binding protein [Treponema sp.]|nr:ATP-binding protein [Treponema sp.]